MVDIDFKQFKMLLKLKHNNIKTDKIELSEEDQDILEFLIKNNFAVIIDDIKYIPSSSNFVIGEIPILNSTTYQITQDGKAQISAYVSSFHKWWIPLVISIGSFILSCISLLKQ